MGPLRVLHIHSRMCGGGIETFIARMAVATKQSCESHVFSCSSGKVYDARDAPAREDDLSSGSLSRNVLALVRHIRRWRPHILHAHWTDAMRFANFARHFVSPKPRVVVHWHEFVDGASETWFGRRSYGQADAVLACSQAVADYQRQERVRSVRVLRNPVDLSAFGGTVSSQMPDAARETNEPLLGLFVGRLSTQHKGLDVLCEAMELVHPSVPVRAVLLGPGDHDAIRAELQPGVYRTLSPLRRRGEGG